AAARRSHASAAALRPKRRPASTTSRRSLLIRFTTVPRARWFLPSPAGRGNARGRHCACTPAAFRTAAHLSRSLARKPANSWGEEIFASTPSLTKVLAISGDCRLALMAALSRSTIAPGVLAGAPTPVHAPDEKSRTPASISVGTSGICELRRSLVEASALTWPASTSGSDDAGFSNENCVSPATVAATDGPPPL